MQNSSVGVEEFLSPESEREGGKGGKGEGEMGQERGGREKGREQRGMREREKDGKRRKGKKERNLRAGRGIWGVVWWERERQSTDLVQMYYWQLNLHWTKKHMVALPAWEDGNRSVM